MRLKYVNVFLLLLRLSVATSPHPPTTQINDVNRRDLDVIELSGVGFGRPLVDDPEHGFDEVIPGADEGNHQVGYGAGPGFDDSDPPLIILSTEFFSMSTMRFAGEGVLATTSKHIQTIGTSTTGQLSESHAPSPHGHREDDDQGAGRLTIADSKPGMPSETVEAAKKEVATSTEVSNSNTPRKSSSGREATQWKIAGIAVLAVMATMLITLGAVFFGSWSRFVKDVFGRNNKSFGSEDLLPDGDSEKGTWAPTMKHDNSQDGIGNSSVTSDIASTGDHYGMDQYEVPHTGGKAGIGAIGYRGNDGQPPYMLEVKKAAYGPGYEYDPLEPLARRPRARPVDIPPAFYVELNRAYLPCKNKIDY